MLIAIIKAVFLALNNTYADLHASLVVEYIHLIIRPDILALGYGIHDYGNVGIQFWDIVNAVGKILDS